MSSKQRQEVKIMERGVSLPDLNNDSADKQSDAKEKRRQTEDRRSSSHKRGARVHSPIRNKQETHRSEKT